MKNIFLLDQYVVLGLYVYPSFRHPLVKMQTLLALARVRISWDVSLLEAVGVESPCCGAPPLRYGAFTFFLKKKLEY